MHRLVLRFAVLSVGLSGASVSACESLKMVCSPQSCGPRWAEVHGHDLADQLSRSLPGRNVDHEVGARTSDIVAPSRSTPRSVANSTNLRKQLTLQSRVPLNQMGGGAGSSLYGWVDPLTKREYAIMGRSNGTSFIDITDAKNPRVVANLPPVAGSSNTSWREPKVYQNTVYIGVDGTNHGVQIMDLTKLRNYSGTTLTVAADSVYTGVSRVHTLFVNEQSGYLYLQGTNVASGGMRVLDVRNPSSPVFAGDYSLDGYNHETQVVTYKGPDSQHVGKEIAFNANGRSGASQDKLNIVDVSNKSNMARISSASYAQAGYTHQTWLTEDQRYLFLNDELDETSGLTNGKIRTHLYDIADLDNPVYRGFFEQNGGIDHNLYVKGNYVYQANYTTGLSVFEIGNLASTNSADWLKLVANYDTYLPTNAATFNGAWNNYPYFPSGNIPISDLDGGLFVVRLEDRLATGAFPTSFNGFTPPGSIDPFAAYMVPEPAVLSLAAFGLLLLGRRR
jgi:choice-of-anchor B domain-containing protein